MIGFEIDATGSNNFTWKSGAWTEGSLVALKIVMSAPKVNVPGSGGTNRGIIGSIEASFSKIAKQLLSNVCSMGFAFTLYLKGDIKLNYVFDTSKSSSQIESEFLKMLATASGGGIGDQVMIHICKCIEAFVIHNLTKSGRGLQLTIDVDL